MRTVIYARFSSQLQNSRSIDDQVAVCRERAEREGWSIVEIFTDYAISGAAGIGEMQRPGLHAMMARVERGGVDQVLAESTDRIARHQGDSFAIRDRLSFAGTRLFTLSDGEVTEISGTFKGLMDAQFRKELGAKIKRGQRGTVSSGRSPAGLAFGYRTANRIDAAGRPVRGLREVDADQSDIVRRIFEEFAAGRSARTIAAALNAEGIAGPRGSHWRASTINGDATRGNGILRNELYVGRLVHNRTSKVVEPVTRNVRIRPNPPSEWQTEEVPHLRIVPQALWDEVQGRRETFEGLKPARCVRPRRMLSGLAMCGVCGQGWIVIGTDRWGCTKHKADGSCTNNRQIITATFEDRVLSGLRERMLDPELVAMFVREYHSEHARRSIDARRSSAKLDRKVAEANAKIERLVAAISGGGAEFAEVKDALAQARADRDRAAAELLEIEALPVVALHPAIAADYRRQVEHLDQALVDPLARDAAIPALRELIDHIIITPHPTKRGVEIEVQGRLASMLALAGAMPAPERMTACGAFPSPAPQPR